MYDELVKRLRDAATMSDALAVLLPHSEGNATAKLYNEAADAIRDVPRWIPVTERLPEERQDVLVALRRGEIAVDYYQPNRWGYRDVTHWMPLPEPPKEE